MTQAGQGQSDTVAPLATAPVNIYPIEDLQVHSWVLYTGDGTTKSWALTSEDAIPIDYLDKSHIKVYFDRVPKTEGVHYTFSSDGRNIVIDPALSAGVKLHINRDTPTEPLVDFSSASIWRSDDLDTATFQSIFISEEGLDYLIGIQRGSIAIGNADQLDGLDSLAFVQVAGDQDITGNKKFHTLQVTARFRVPGWTTATRPNNPSDGMFGFNSEYDFLEVWDASDNEWKMYRDSESADNYYVNVATAQTIDGDKTFIGRVGVAPGFRLPAWNNAMRPDAAAEPDGVVGVNRQSPTNPYIEFAIDDQWYAVPTTASAQANFVRTDNTDQSVLGVKTFNAASFALQLGLPVWANAGRPKTPQTGWFGYNTSRGAAEIWSGAAWERLLLTADLVPYATLAHTQDFTGFKAFTAGAAVLGRLEIPVWTTTTRPSAPKLGTFGLNSQTNVLEHFDGTGWIAFAASDVVTVTTAQTITGDKVFQGKLSASSLLVVPKSNATGDAPPEEALIRYNTVRNVDQLSYKDSDDSFKWYAIPRGVVNPNLILNGDFRYRQRGDNLSGILPPNYLYDRFAFVSSNPAATCDASITQLYSSGNRTGFDPPARVATFVMKGHQAGGYTGIRHVSEGLFCANTELMIPADEELCLSFWASSPQPFQLIVSLYQKFGTGGSPDTSVSPAVTMLTTTLTFYQFRFKLPSLASKVMGTDPRILIDFRADSPAGNYTLTLGNIKIERGPIYTGWAPHTDQDQCYRYFWRPGISCTFYGYAGFIGQWMNAVPIQYPRFMYKIPTIRVGAVTSLTNIANVRGESISAKAFMLVGDAVAVGQTNGWCGDWDVNAEMVVW